MRCVLALLAASAFGTGMAAHADRQCLDGPPEWPAEWTADFPAHRVIGNLYAVGTADLGVFLLTTPAGHILINTGLEDSLPQIRANIEQLGFHLTDVKYLLTTQAHFDHAAALAEVKELTGAQVWATERDAPILADGGASDPHFGDCTEFRFRPIAVEKTLADGEVIELGGFQLTTHLHPGHTEGSASYTFTHHEEGRDYAVVIANMGTINPGKHLVVEPTYPGVDHDFAETFRQQKAMPVDVWVASHGSQYHLADKYHAGQAYSPDTFVDPEGFRAEVSRLETLYLQQRGEETQHPPIAPAAR